MKITDYSKIADHYDANPIRHYYVKEPLIEEMFNLKGNLRVLDLACGTGNFLKAQYEAFNTDKIKWSGLDKSTEMLNFAREKLAGIELTEADAENMPYENASFDIITNNFAFHHFYDKSKAVSEISRILKPGGLFFMRNICIEYMTMSWVYHYFPSTFKIDKKRFWNNKRIFLEFEKAGFSVEIITEISLKRNDFNDLIKETENRDMSQLNLISDEKYKKGLDRIKKDQKKDGFFMGDFAMMRCIARKKSDM